MQYSINNYSLIGLTFDVSTEQLPFEIKVIDSTLDKIIGIEIIYE